MNEDKPAEHADKYIFFVDNKEIVTERSSLTGQDIKAIARVPGEYQLFLEEKGDNPDRVIPDSETVDLRKSIKRFYAVPPATFG